MYARMHDYMAVFTTTQTPLATGIEMRTLWQDERGDEM